MTHIGTTDMNRRLIWKGAFWGLGLTVIGTILVLPILFFATPDAATAWSPWIFMLTSFVGVPFFVVSGLLAKVLGLEMSKLTIVCLAYIINPLLGGLLGMLIAQRRYRKQQLANPK